MYHERSNSSKHETNDINKKKLSSIPNVIISGKIQIDTTLIKYVKLLPQTLSWIYTPNTSCRGHLDNTNKWGEAKT